MTGKHSIAKVLEHYGGKEIPERLGWQKTKCVFHDDSHASASVNTTENVFVCHGCGVKGDTYKVIMEKEGVQFREAITIAEELTGESHKQVSRKSTSSRRVPSQSRNHLSRRAYNPPRRSRRATNGT